MQTFLSQWYENQSKSKNNSYIYKYHNMLITGQFIVNVSNLSLQK